MSDSYILRIPNEMVDRIIAGLWDDRDTLRACTTTCRLLSPAAQRQLFHRLVLVGPFEGDHVRLADLGMSPERLRVLLDQHPRLGAYFECLEIFNTKICCELLSKGYPNRDVDKGASREWFALDDVLETCIPYLTGLKALIIQNSVENEYDAELQLEKYELLLTTLTNLVYISIEGLPLEIIENASPNLRHLSIDDIVPLKRNQVQPEIVGSRPIYLESLRVGLSVDKRSLGRLVSGEPKTAIRVSRLRKLDIHCSGTNDHQILFSLLRDCSNTLEDLDLSPGPHIVGEPDTSSNTAIIIDLNQLVRLRKLKISLSKMSWYPAGQLCDVFAWFEKVLELWLVAADMEEMTLDVHYHFGRGVQVDFSGWKAISDALLSERFPALRKLNIMVSSMFEEEVPASEYVALLEVSEHTDQLRRSKKLNFSLQRGRGFQSGPEFLPDLRWTNTPTHYVRD